MTMESKSDVPEVAVVEMIDCEEANDAQNMAPVAEAVPLVCKEEEATTTGETNKSGHTNAEELTNRRIFKVVAPADLPKGYRLTVVVQAAKSKKEEEVVVLVPPGGVRKMQTFEGKEARPITKRWADSEFDCSPNYEGSFCWVAFCIPAIAWAFVMRKLGMDACGRQPDNDDIREERSKSNAVPWIVGSAFFLYWLGIVNPFLQPILAMYLLYIAVVARGAVRKKYNIPGSCCQDCLCISCFGCCTVLQSFRHMKRNGDTPFEGCGDRKAVAIQV